MASFGPQVKNMAQAGAGGGGEKAFADSKGHCEVHRSEPFRFPVSPAPPADNAAPSLPRPRIDLQVGVMVRITVKRLTSQRCAPVGMVALAAVALVLS